MRIYLSVYLSLYLPNSACVELRKIIKRIREGDSKRREENQHRSTGHDMIRHRSREGLIIRII